ncbi:hypothetical protein [Nocardioides convexus]|uniref:hypothetical protein n=1 Tax=Nocardioides convexus TaxID=2712224 RepID=UPI0024188C3D|nr:hypothetical protein [Nocardioides convexus]
MSTSSTATAVPGQMTHREILEALTGLLLAMFVAMLSSTVVSNALPAIVTDLHGSQTGYTWVVVATLLTMTATTPIWGKAGRPVQQEVRWSRPRWSSSPSAPSSPPRRPTWASSSARAPSRASASAA